MAAVDDARATLLAKLVAAGLNATSNPADVSPPSVLVGPPTIDRIALLGPNVRVDVTFPVRVLEVGPGNEEALSKLLGSVPVALVALAKDRPGEATPFVYVAGEDTEHPGYEFTVTKQVTL